MANPMQDGHLWQCGVLHACGGAPFAHLVHCLVRIHGPIIVYGAHRHGATMFGGVAPWFFQWMLILALDVGR